MARPESTGANSRRGGAMRAFALALLLGFGAAEANPALDEVAAAVRLRDYDKAARLLTSLALRGDSEAQYRLAGLYRTGRGVEASDKRAVHWLERAARKGHAEAQYSLGLAYLTGRGVESDARAGERWLLLAADKGHAAAASRLQGLDRTEESAAEPLVAEAPGADAAGLRRAAGAGDLERVRALLDAGVAVDAADQYGRTALIEAVAQGRLAVARELLARGANPERSDRFGDNALLMAAVRGRDQLVALLLARGARVNARDRDANTALLLAAARGHPATVATLLRGGADPAARNKRGQDALALAPSDNKRLQTLLARPGRSAAQAREDSADQARARLARTGKDPGQYANWAPVMLAAWRRQHELLDAIIARGDPVNIRDAEGHSPLSRAVVRADAKAVSKLLAAGARTDLPGVSPSALIQALKGGTPESAAIARRLLGAGADPNVVDRIGAPALVLAVETGDPALVAAMLQAGARIESADRAGVTALMHGAHNGDLAVVRDLLRQGASLDAVDLRGRRALDHAVESSSTEVMQHLFEAGARPSVGPDGSNLFHRVARSGSGVLIPILLNHSVRPDLPDLQGNTPLMVAAALGHAQVVEVLLALEADIGHRNSSGDTALHLAVANSRAGTTEILLAHGADPRTRNHNGENAVTLAQALDNPELARLIEQAGGGRWLGLF